MEKKRKKLHFSVKVLIGYTTIWNAVFECSEDADCAIGFLLFGDGSLWSGRCKKIRQDWLEDHGNLSFDYVFCSIYRCDFR